uniref:Transposase n=1 Tax=Leptobrachium leishanense TaxID=445787 RepID=A0A8C5LME3_9ANUR
MPRRKELSEDLRSRIVDLHEAGKGYKSISKSLDVHVSTVRQTDYKWRKFSTVATLPRCGRPVKMTMSKLVREAAKRPTATLKELQAYLASTGCVVHVTTISRILHMSGLWGRLARRKPFLTKKNIQAWQNFNTIPTVKHGGGSIMFWGWNYEQFQITVNIGTKSSGFC